MDSSLDEEFQVAEGVEDDAVHRPSGSDLEGGYSGDVAVEAVVVSVVGDVRSEFLCVGCHGVRGVWGWCLKSQDGGC